MMTRERGFAGAEDDAGLGDAAVAEDIEDLKDDAEKKGCPREAGR